ncbi:MAG: hypothetical protein OXC18_18545 [Desulfurellaceae bacterium]|nr:hypothetical protein [Desulfurellaceae bacterium]
MECGQTSLPHHSRTLGGHQVLKKWLSYRGRAVLERALVPDEVWYFAEVARRIGAILVVTETPAVSD